MNAAAPPQADRRKLPRRIRRARQALSRRFSLTRARVVEPALVHPSEGGVATAAQPRPLATSLAALLTRHVLHDGELVILILKPSLWFIVIGALRFAAVVLIGIIAARLWGPDQAKARLTDIGVFLIAGRVMWAVLQWMGRLYVLTDMRVLRLSGVFNVDIYDCPLRKIAMARLHRSFRERILHLGSIEIVPSDEACPAGEWRTIKRPVEVLETIEATVRRAKQGGMSCG